MRFAHDEISSIQDKMRRFAALKVCSFWRRYAALRVLGVAFKPSRLAKKNSAP